MTNSSNYDKLDYMMAQQLALQTKLGTIQKIQNPCNRQEFINQMILALIEESVEIMRETPYKNPEYVKFGWKKGQTYNEEAFKDEIIDLWHFVMNLCIVAKMSPDEFVMRYNKKNKINHERKEGGY